jgi:hypothetical protein
MDPIKNFAKMSVIGCGAGSTALISGFKSGIIKT